MASRYNLRVKPRPPNQPSSSPTANSKKSRQPQSKKARSKEGDFNLNNSATVLPDLPVEIIHHVISSCLPNVSLLNPSAPLAFQNREHLKEQATSLDPYHYFVTSSIQFTLVCKRWALITQSIFYRTLVLRDAKRVFHLAAMLHIWGPEYTRSPLRHVRGIHLCVELDHSAVDKVDEVVQCIRAATRDVVGLETLTLSQVGDGRIAPIPWSQFTEVLSNLSSNPPMLSMLLLRLSLPGFCHALQVLHVPETIFELVDDGNPFSPTFPSLVELRLTVKSAPFRPPFNDIKSFAPGNWLLPSLRSITVSGWRSRGFRDNVNFLPFLRKYGLRVEHLFLDGFHVNRSRILSSCMSPEHIQECLDALPHLRHLVLTQMPWMAFKSQDSQSQFSHPKLAWIDYGVVPSTVNFLRKDKAEFTPNPLGLAFSSSDVPRIRGGARTKSSPRWGNETYVKLKAPGPVPPGWGSGLPNLQGMRKVDFSLFRLMPVLTRDTLPPATGLSETSIPFSKDAVIRETKGRVYLWIPDAALREVFYNEWKLDPHEDVRVGL
ncbi:hypothetical protein DL96DRAFT_1588643 [Flagelloscypha sp. PMI_526]|nr:hypothetical protein DL96DRAFT_1588643 [Flagelloscypha sp. PMI_526]